MKKIQAKVSEKTLIADIYISDAEKNILGYSCAMIAEEYMKKNHPDTKGMGIREGHIKQTRRERKLERDMEDIRLCRSQRSGIY